MRTWKCLRWTEKPEQTKTIVLACPRCGEDSEMQIGEPGCLIIASIGLGLIFDPPGAVPAPHFMPDAVQCRHCKTIWESSDVR